MWSEFVAAMAALLRKSPSKTSLRTIRLIHAKITLLKPTHQSIFLHNNLISAYAKTHLLTEARKVFDEMPERNIVSYNTLISAYVNARKTFDEMPERNNLVRTAFSLLSGISHAGLRPSSSTMSSLLQASSSVADVALGSTLHAQTVNFGFSTNVRIQTSLLVMYSACGLDDLSERVFDGMPCKDAVAWNAFIMTHLKMGDCFKALKLFVAMKREGVKPTGFSFSIAINACSGSGEEPGLHAQIVKVASIDDLPLQNSMIDMYATWGDMDSARAVFEELRRKDLVSWNSMLAGFSMAGDRDKMWELFMELRASKDEPLADEYTFSAVISSNKTTLHALVIKFGLECSLFVCGALLKMYFQNEDPASARKLFMRIPLKDAVLFTIMIGGDSENAIGYLCMMLEESHAMDSFSICSALSSSADLSLINQGKLIHCMAKKTGLEEEFSVCGGLVDMYAKNGDLAAASAVFHGVSDHDAKTWNALISGYSLNGHADQAFRLFDEMVDKGIKPDQITFLSLISACDHCGQVDRARILWREMVEEDGLSPGPKHYTSMVSLLGRAGLLQEAEELILMSTFASSMADLWRCLLSSCMVFRDLQRGVRAGEWALNIDPDDGSTHVLLSNLFSAAGEWDAVASVRRRIRTLQLEKEPGLSWIEVSDIVRVFSAGDDESLKSVLLELAANLYDPTGVDAVV